MRRGNAKRGGGGRGGGRMLRERERGPGRTHLSFGLKYFCLKGRAHKLESKGIRRERKGVERGKNSFEI